MKKVMVFSGSRSDYSRLLPVCRAVEQSEVLQLYLVLGAMHTLEGTEKELDQKVNPSARIESDANPTTGEGAAEMVSETTCQFTAILQRVVPDVVLVLGDRFELMGVVAACVCVRIPIAHIGGGQITEGALDEQVRHMVTKASHLHYVATDDFAERVRLMGEESWRVRTTGSPSIDSMASVEVLSVEDLGRELGLDLGRPTVLVTLHPESVETGGEASIQRFFKALSKLPFQMILTHPNGDPGSDLIIRYLERLKAAKGDDCVLVSSLGIIKYTSALKYCSVMVGNSSSGLIEAPYWGLPVVNVGDRQKGRPVAENVVNCPFDEERLQSVIIQAVEGGRVDSVSPFGDGRSASRIVSHLEEALLLGPSRLLTKSYAMPVVPGRSDV